MDEIKPFVDILFLRTFGDLSLPGGHHRREEMVPHIVSAVSTVLEKNGAPVSMIPVDEWSNQFFDFLVEGKAMRAENHRFAGVYYSYVRNSYIDLRNKTLQGNAIHNAAERIGGKFFRDTFAGYMSEGDADARELANRGALTIPASDRIVSIGDNAAPLVEELEYLKKELAAHNDEEGRLVGRRERIVGELSAGQELLKVKSVRVKALVTVLISTLGFIAAEFAGGIIGDLAVKLLEQLKSLMGL